MFKASTKGRAALALGDGNGVTGRCSEFIFSEVGKKND